MSGTFAGEQLMLELAISLAGIALIFTVLLRFGLLSLIITFYTSWRSSDSRCPPTCRSRTPAQLCC